jgi:non-ribosomal peptide synthetase component F
MVSTSQQGAGHDRKRTSHLKSGSTRQPKRVLVGHEALANRLKWMGPLHEVGERDTILRKTPARFYVTL